MRTRRSTILHCCLHTTFSAIPSFCVAYGTGWNRASQLLGMCAGILLFMCFAILIHLRGPLAHWLDVTTAYRAISWTKNLRAVQVALSLPMALSLSGVIPFTVHPYVYEKFLGGALAHFLRVELFAGLWAVYLTDFLMTPAGQQPFSVATQGPAMQFFAEACVATFTEGMILACGMGAIATLLWMLILVAGVVRPNEKH